MVCERCGVERGPEAKGPLCGTCARSLSATRRKLWRCSNVENLSQKATLGGHKRAEAVEIARAPVTLPKVRFLE